MTLLNSELLIPYALRKDGIPVSPTTARKEDNLICPECRKPLFLKTGKVRRWHFSHYSETDERGCSFGGEGQIHITAKHSVFIAVKEGIRDLRQRPQIRSVCATCGGDVWQPMPRRICNCDTEGRVPGSGRKLDVALLDADGALVAGVEIFNTHRVGAEKEEELKGIPWMELDAREVIEEPLKWSPIKTRGFNDTIKCKSALCGAIEAMESIPGMSAEALGDYMQEQRGLACGKIECPRMYPGYRVGLDKCEGCWWSWGKIGIHKNLDGGYVLCVYEIPEWFQKIRKEVNMMGGPQSVYAKQIAHLLRRVPVGEGDKK